MTVADDLRAARKLIENPSRWAQGLTYTRPWSGTRCASEAIFDATCCGDGGVRTNDVFQILKGMTDGRSLVGWNDQPKRTHAEVLDLFDRAIAKAEETS